MSLSTATSLSLMFIMWTCCAREQPEWHPPAAGFQKCQEALNRPMLGVLPGGGWDNLRNLDMGRVMSLNYSLCKTTKDGAYIIPNDVFTIALKQSSLEMNSEIIESWMDYQCTTAVSINAGLSFSHINGRFSSDFRRAKTHQVRDKSVSTKVQIRNLMYSVKTDPTTKLDEGFHQQLVTIANQLEKNKTQMANYLAEILVLNYGTHVLTGVDVGASLVQEDYIKATFVKDGQSMRSAITAAAGISFQNIINFNMGVSVGAEDNLTKQYQGNRTSSRVESFGGLPFYPGITLKTWQESITNQLVALDRSGLPLPFFITPNNLPGLPSPILKKLSKTIESAIDRYYTFNTYPGCINPASPNFNFYANVDDGTCEGMATNFTFGGVYQDCARLEGPDADVLCQALEQKNPLTGDFSCPVGYTSIKLRSQQREEGFSHLDCHRDCFLWKLFCKWICNDIFTLSKVQFSSHWCAARGPVPETSAFLFGGLFSAKSTNPVTNAQSCPSRYYPLKLFDQLKVCVSSDERGKRHSVPFGGFFSCQIGNPLSGLPNGTENDSYLKRCPAGFSQHLALISDGCQVEYCVQAGRFTDKSLPQARLPPFTQKPAISFLATDIVLVTSSNGDQTWIKDPQTQQWKLGNSEDVLHSLKRGGDAGGGLSNGEAAGITIAAAAGLAILIGIVVRVFKRYKKREFSKIEGEKTCLISNNPVYGLLPEMEDTLQPEQEKQPV
ncbi:macrophage-expressed gene 1 protein [Ahaetulla prasina]|uniref:macrophage-expressed gene 1 protein n=1 Tax=Ahaetulla prasina TaxID=499056 RepID=UPI0026470B08|nr:macrophage-expressed gene 1 protein [Ahaetulla prasina]